MAIRIGDIELRGVQTVRADDNRALVELRVPGQSGAVFQDLGRTPAALTLEGLITGEDSEQVLETLRGAYQSAEPMSFASDIAVGTEMTEVVIADLLVRQEAGYQDRYRFSLKLREHVEPPENSAANMAQVDAAAADDGGAWAGDAVAAAGALDDPASLTDAMADNPGLLDRLSADELAGAIGDNLDTLSGDQLGDMLDTVGSLDPSKAGGIFDALQGSGQLGGFLGKLIAAGRKILDVARKIGGLIGAAGDVMDLIEAAKRVGQAARDLFGRVGDLAKSWSDGSAFKLPEDPNEEPTVPSPTPKDVLADVTEFVDALADLVALPIIRRARDLAKDLGILDIVDTVARALISGVEFVERIVAGLRKAAEYVAGLGAVLRIAASFEELVEVVAELDDSQDVVESSAKVFAVFKLAAAWAGAAPSPSDVDALAQAFADLKAGFRYFTLAQGTLPSSLATEGEAA